MLVTNCIDLLKLYIYEMNIYKHETYEMYIVKEETPSPVLDHALRIQGCLIHLSLVEYG